MGRVCDSATNCSAANSSDGPVRRPVALSCRALPQQPRAEREFAGKMPHTQVKKMTLRVIRISRPTHANSCLAGLNGSIMIAHRMPSSWLNFDADGWTSP